MKSIFDHKFRFYTLSLALFFVNDIEFRTGCKNIFRYGSVQWCRNRGGQGGHWPPPQYLADQLTLFQPGRADYPHLFLVAPPMFFTFRHHCGYETLNCDCYRGPNTLIILHQLNQLSENSFVGTVTFYICKN